MHTPLQRDTNHPASVGLEPILPPLEPVDPSVAVARQREPRRYR